MKEALEIVPSMEFRNDDIFQTGILRLKVATVGYFLNTFPQLILNLGGDFKPGLNGVSWNYYFG